jgi:hypothetical protein
MGQSIKTFQIKQENTMCTVFSPHSRNIPLIMISLLVILVLAACGAQPTSAPTNVPPTQALPSPSATSVPPAEELPSPTRLPPTSTPLPPVQVGSLNEILGEWSAVCGAGTCVIKFNEDGTYKHWYVKTTETGVSGIDAGTITYTDGVFHLVSVNGSCENQAKRKMAVFRPPFLIILFPSPPETA